MGFRDAEWAYSLDLPSSQKAVLVAYAHRTDDKTHQTFVGQQTVVTMTGLSRSTVLAALAALEDSGIVTRTRRNGRGGYRTSDVVEIQATYVQQSNVGEPDLGATYVQQPDDLGPNAGRPRSSSYTAEEIIQRDHSEGQGALTLVENRASDTEPPRRCSRHTHSLDDSPCRDCRDARHQHTAWHEARKPAAVPTARPKTAAECSHVDIGGCCASCGTDLRHLRAVSA